MKCFYHSADLDGLCSGAIVKYFNPECELFPINYGEEFPWSVIEKDEKVFMVDFCLQPFEDMLRLSVLSNLTWVDHHKTAIDQAKEVDFPVFKLLDTTQAACELTWQLFSTKSETPLVVTMLGRYDIWDHGFDYKILPFQYGMRRKFLDPQHTMHKWKVLFETPYLDESVVKEGLLILAYEEEVNSRYCKLYAFETTLNHRPSPQTERTFLQVIALNQGQAGSLVFKSVYNSEKHDLMLSFVLLPVGLWTVSLYSDKEEIDCGEIAKSYGGGGHKGAAGFQCDILPFEIGENNHES